MRSRGLIPTRDYGLNHATGDVLGRFDADCMIRPDWVEVVAGIFTEDPEAMGATGPVMYYDMPRAVISGFAVTTPPVSAFTRPMMVSRCCLVRIWRCVRPHGMRLPVRCAVTSPM